MEFNFWLFLLWSLCGLVWWSIAHLALVLIPGRLWLEGVPAIAVGAIVGTVAYAKFSFDSSTYWASTPRFLNLTAPMLTMGFIAGGIIGGFWARGTTTGPASILPGYEFPPTSSWRLINGLVCGGIGLAATWGMIYSLEELEDRPWILFASLLGVLSILYVVFPLVAFRFM